MNAGPSPGVHHSGMPDALVNARYGMARDAARIIG
jgi:hypothetical protein